MIGRVRGYLMLATWVLSLAVAAPFAIVLTKLTGREEFITWPTTLVLRVGYFLGGVRWTVTGREKLDPNGVYVYAINHQSIVDAPMVWLIFGTPSRRAGFLFKKEVERIPVLGTGVKAIGMLVVDRQNQEAALKSTRKATEKLKEGRSFTVFVEGTRTRDGKLRAFKKGAFHMAISAGAPVVPVTIDGAFDAMPPGAFRIESVPIRVTIHDPIPTAGLSSADAEALMDRTREAVASALPEKLRNPNPEPPAFAKVAKKPS